MSAPPLRSWPCARHAHAYPPGAYEGGCPGCVLESERELMRIVSLLRTCPDCCPAMRAKAAVFIEGEPTSSVYRCSNCYHPMLVGHECPCAELAAGARPGDVYRR